MRYSSWIKEKLLSLIKELDQYHWLFTRNAEKDFSRVKKWSFGEVVRFIISMEGKSLKDELLKRFNFSMETPTNSSFNQRRAQILPEAFEFLFREFNQVTYQEKLHRGYRMLACDGSDLSIAYDPLDETTYFQSTPDSKGFNQMHLNALYDLLNRTYEDAIIQPSRQENEYAALHKMIDRYHSAAKTLFIADRNYESYNIFAHIHERGMFYLIRTKDIHKQGIVSAARSQLPTNQESFDATVKITLTNQQTKEILANPGKYRIVMRNQRFDYLSDRQRFYDMEFRVVRFPLSDNLFECIITNLPQEEFSLNDIKELYHMRWGIETSFRELKYAIGLTNFHSKKRDYIRQEIWARLILYNFCEAITTRTVMKQNDRKRKHSYQLNYTRAIHICRYFLSIRKEAPPDVEFLISRELLPVRPGRSDPRKVKFQSAVSFLYRVA